MIGIAAMERTGRAIATVEVDPDSFLVTCAWVEIDYPAPVRDTAALYADLLGVLRQPGLLTVGDVLFTVAEPDRLAQFEWRAGPAALRRGEVNNPAARPASLHVAVDWDENGRAAIESGTSGVFDGETRSLCIAFGPDPVCWLAPADGVAVGLSSAHRFAALYLEQLPTDLCHLVGRH